MASQSSSLTRARLIALLAIALIVMVGGVVTVTIALRTGPQSATTTIVYTGTLTTATIFSNGGTSTTTSITSGTVVYCPTCIGGNRGTDFANGIDMPMAYANATSKTVTFAIRGQAWGSVDVSLQNATITGLADNSGYRGTMMISLRGFHLRNSDAVYVTTPPIPNLVIGDVIRVNVGTSVGSVWATLTAGK